MPTPRLHRPPLLPAAVCAIAIAVAGCGSAAPSPTGSPTPSAAATATETAAVTPTAAATSSPATTATPAGNGASGCQLKASLGPPNSPSGHSVVTVVLTDDGTAACSLSGYPTVSLANTSGPVTGLTQVDGGSQATSSGVATVPIAVGAAGQFTVEFTDIPTGSAACAGVVAITAQLPSSAGQIAISLPSALQPCGSTFSVGPITAAD